MRKSNFLWLIALLFLVLQACSTGSNKNSEDAADSTNKANMPVAQSDADFMVNACIGGTMEVRMGEVARQNTMNDRVKAFGEMMVSDHGKANDELKALAAEKNIALPDSLSTGDQSDIDRLKDKKSQDFDEAYIDEMVKDHKKDIDEFEKGADNVQDADIKAFITKTLPVLRMHLDSAQAIQDAFSPDHMRVPAGQQVP